MDPFEQKNSFVDNMFTIVNWGGIPATESREVAEVLRNHLSNMKQMPKDTLEFKAGLEAAKVLDKQYRELRQREAMPKDHVWMPESTWRPLGEERKGGAKALKASCDPGTTITEDEGLLPTKEA